MLFEFIAVVVAGVAVAGITAGMRWISAGRLPKWMVPASAGFAMLSYALWSEYSWFSRVTDPMPPGIVVTWTNSNNAIWRPWTYFAPVVDRFTAIDTRNIKRHLKQPDQIMVDMVLAARWQPAARLKTVYDCKSNRQANLYGAEASVAEDGAIVGASWSHVSAEDRSFIVACQGS